MGNACPSYCLGPLRYVDFTVYFLTIETVDVPSSNVHSGAFRILYKGGGATLVYCRSIVAKFMLPLMLLRLSCSVIPGIFFKA